jgi:HEAT repeat protein
VIRASVVPILLTLLASAGFARAAEPAAAANPAGPPSSGVLAELRPKVLALLSVTDGAPDRWKALGAEALTVLRQLASDPAETPARRAAATASMAYVDNPAATEVLRAYSTDANVLPQVRQGAVQALAAREGVQAVAMLSPLLSDGDTEVRRSVAKALGDVAGPAARAALQARLAAETNPQVRDDIQKALARTAN